jgi:hypothetical protein
MPAQLFDIFFSGQIMEGQDPAEVRERIRNLFNSQDDQLQRLFSGESVRIKGGVDEEEASKYRVAFREAGALVEIKLAESGALSASTPTDAPTLSETDTAEETAGSDGLTLLPPNTGSLIDCAPDVEPQEIPDISSLNLAPEGTLIDESEETPAAHIDTGDLTVEPAQSGTLEDCQQPVDPYPIPDISSLEMELPEEEETPSKASD